MSLRVPPHALAAFAAACLLVPTHGGGTPLRGSALPATPSIGTLSWPARQLDLRGAWAATDLGGPVTIAVLDTGIADVSAVRDALLPGIDLVNSDSDPADDNGHGTQVAGIAAARGKVGGVCATCSLLPVKVLDATKSGRASVVAAGVRWAVDHGASVINLSLNAPSDRPELNAALNDAIAAGVTVVLSAGNGGSANPASDGYPGPGVPGAIRVGASTKALTIATWSNRGESVDIAAPGWATAFQRNGALSDVSGTSFSAAYVSGLAGLLLAHDPALTPAQVKALILSSGTQVANLPVLSGRVTNAGAAVSLAVRG
jgi:subtilisin family serine protease